MEFQDHHMHPLASIIGISFWSLFLGLLRGRVIQYVRACAYVSVPHGCIQIHLTQMESFYVTSMVCIYFFPQKTLVFKEKRG